MYTAAITAIMIHRDRTDPANYFDPAPWLFFGYKGEFFDRGLGEVVAISIISMGVLFTYFYLGIFKAGDYTSTKAKRWIHPTNDANL